MGLPTTTLADFSKDEKLCPSRKERFQLSPLHVASAGAEPSAEMGIGMDRQLHVPALRVMMGDVMADGWNGLWQFQLLKERILNAVNKNPASRSYGCCDRHYWGWKVRDFPDMTLQYSLLAFGKLIHQESDFERDLFRAMVRFWVRNIHKDGSADQMFPHEKSVGPTLYGLGALLSSYHLILTLTSENERPEIENSINRSLQFALKNPESYGHIGNHKALFAYCFLLAYTLFGETKYQKAYHREMEELFAHFQDGWFLEYETADPGYQTQCLHYLTLCYQIDPQDEIKRKVLAGIEDFCSYFLFPDKSYAGLFAGRATELFYPYPFFYWAEKSEVSRQIVGFLYRDPSDSLVKWPALDYENAVRLGTNYLLSFPLYRSMRLPGEFSGLPCLGGREKNWKSAGLVVISDAMKYGAVNLYRGGIFKFVDKSSKKHIQDTGYVIEYKGKKYTNAIFSTKAICEKSQDGRYSVYTGFYLIRDDYLDPAKLVFLRLFGLRILQFAGFTNFVKRVMVRALLMKKEAGPFTFSRVLKNEGGIFFLEDIIEPADKNASFLCSSTTRMFPFHMACAGYFAGGSILDRDEYSFNGKKLSGVTRIKTSIDWECSPISIEREFFCSPS